jgi:hypothetical protein
MSAEYIEGISIPLMKMNNNELNNKFKYFRDYQTDKEKKK